MKVKIIMPPPGEAPLHIREQWVGLVLPVPDRFSGKRKWSVFGVLSGRPGLLERILRSLTGGIRKSEGYAVEAYVAVAILEKKSPEAAAWWRQNVPFTNTPGRMFVFAAQACEEIRDA